MFMQKDMREITIDQVMIEEEKKLRTELIKQIQLEESIYNQKLRVQWTKLGDSDTAYFFANMKNRKAQNQITMLTKEDGTNIIEMNDIKEEVLGSTKSY